MRTRSPCFQFSMSQLSPTSISPCENHLLTCQCNYVRTTYAYLLNILSIKCSRNRAKIWFIWWSFKYQNFNYLINCRSWRQLYWHERYATFICFHVVQDWARGSTFCRSCTGTFSVNNNSQVMEPFKIFLHTLKIYHQYTAILLYTHILL